MADWIDFDAVNGSETCGPRRREGIAALLSLAGRCPRLRKLRLSEFSVDVLGLITDAGSAQVLLESELASLRLDALEELVLEGDGTDYHLLLPLLGRASNLHTLIVDYLPCPSFTSTELPPLRHLVVGALALHNFNLFAILLSTPHQSLQKLSVSIRLRMVDDLVAAILARAPLPATLSISRDEMWGPDAATHPLPQRLLSAFAHSSTLLHLSLPTLAENVLDSLPSSLVSLEYFGESPTRRARRAEFAQRAQRRQRPQTIETSPPSLVKVVTRLIAAKRGGLPGLERFTLHCDLGTPGRGTELEGLVAEAGRSGLVITFQFE